MKLVVDTNIWIDLYFGNLLDEFMKLPHIIYCPDVIIQELKIPDGKKLVRLGVVELTLGPSDVSIVTKLVNKYPKPDINDLFALVLAKVKNAKLATGNGHLREAAIAESIKVTGTIGILKLLIDESIISSEQAADTLDAILARGDRWLPKLDCERHINKWRNVDSS